MDTNMNLKWQELCTLLRLVALPVTGQVRLVTDDCCRLERLARALGNWRRELPPELQRMLTPGQARILADLEHELYRACEESTSYSWTDTAMRRSHGVRQARRLARAALVRFDWRLVVPKGECPPLLPASRPHEGPRVLA